MALPLPGAVVGIDDEDDSTFTVTVDNKTFHFQVGCNCALDPDQQYCGFVFMKSASGSVLFSEFGSGSRARFFYDFKDKKLFYSQYIS